MLGHLEVYLTARVFGDRSRQAGLDVCIPTVKADGSANGGLVQPAAVGARAATVPMVSGLFASLMHVVSVDQLEGRLGTELVRIRTLFQNITPRSLVMLDELCSGTNPSEAAEIVLIVLRLLGELAPYAFTTTHFLDLASQYEAQPPLPLLRFLQVEVG